MTSGAPQVGPYSELEPPEFLARNLRVGAVVAAAAQSFALLAFVFAYLYLRTLNSNGDWRPKHVNPSGGIGVALVVCLVACALAYGSGLRRLGDDGADSGWRLGAAASLVLGVAAFGLIIAQFASISFGPTSGGYASVFIGWHAFYGLNLLLLLGWLETLVAQSLRGRRRPVAPRTTDAATPLELMRPAGDAFSVVLYVAIAFGVLGYVLLYVA